MKIRSIAIAVLMAAALPVSALAQEAGQAGNAASSTSAEQQQGPYENFDAFLQAFGSADFAGAAENFAPEGTSTFTVVSLGTLADSDPARLQEAITARPEELRALREAVAANDTAVAYLEDEGLTPDDVVWAEPGEDGTVLLYVTPEGGD